MAQSLWGGFWKESQAHRDAAKELQGGKRETHGHHPFLRIHRRIGEAKNPGPKGTRKAEGRRDFQIYLANYTSWSPKGEEYFEKPHMKEVDLHLGVEHRCLGAGLTSAVNSHRHKGWKTFVCPAKATRGPKGEAGTSGGAWALLKGGLQHTPLG